MARRWGSAIGLLTLWLAFECFVSWRAFCENGSPQSGPNQADAENNCVFRGPVLSIARAGLGWLRHTFDDAESYIALFTAVLVVATVLLWWSTRNLWKVTNATLGHSEETAQRQLRAYVLVSMAGPARDSINTVNPITAVSLTNYGNTPAHGVTFWRVSRFCHGGAAERWFNEADHLKEWSSPAMLGPGATMTFDVTANIVLSDSDVTGIRDGTHDLIVFGQVHYMDAFEKAQRTDLRFRYDWSESAGWVVVPYETGNSAT